MFTTIDVHVHEDDTEVEVNEDANGIRIRDVGSFDPRITLFFGTTKGEILRNTERMQAALMELRSKVRDG